MSDSNVKFVAFRRDVRFALQFTGENIDALAPHCLGITAATLADGASVLLLSVPSIQGMMGGSGAYDTKTVRIGDWITGLAGEKAFGVVPEGEMETRFATVMTHGAPDKVVSDAVKPDHIKIAEAVVEALGIDDKKKKAKQKETNDAVTQAGLEALKRASASMEDSWTDPGLRANDPVFSVQPGYRICPDGPLVLDHHHVKYRLMFASRSRQSLRADEPDHYGPVIIEREYTRRDALGAAVKQWECVPRTGDGMLEWITVLEALMQHFAPNAVKPSADAPSASP